MKAVWVGAVVLLGTAVSAQERVLNSFETDAEMGLVVPRDSAVRITTQGVTHGERALEIEFRRVQFPALFLRPPAPWDLSEGGEIAWDITNPGPVPVRFSVRVDGEIRNDGVVAWRTGTGFIEPGATATFAFPLASRDPMAYGMRGLPVNGDARNLGSNGTYNLRPSQIAQMQIFLASPAETFTLVIDHVRVRPPAPLAGIVDRFGQFTGAPWAGKVESEAEMDRKREEEAEWLRGNERFEERSEFGGFTAGPRLEASGYFRTAKYEGRWWLVDPAGYLFFSTGFNAMAMAQTTFTTGREEMFTWLPTAEDPLARHVSTATAMQGPIRSGATYNFHAANLERKYGEGFAESWRAVTLARLQAWGFNTIGNWSDPQLHRRGVPYVTTTTLFGNYNTVPNAGVTGNRLPDPFDPRFAGSVRDRIAAAVAAARFDPYCLGHFVDNELNWGNTGSDRARYGVALGALGQNAAASPARRAMGALLEARYTTIERLNMAWGSQYASWAELTAPATISAGMRADLADLTTAYAREYFRVVGTELRGMDPDHLYLGSRMNNVNPDVVAGAAAETDVLSFNVYQAAIAGATWSLLERLDRPALIGEFHFGALDRGMFHTGLQSTASQEERAAAMLRYLRSVADQGNFVGAHWFQLTDQAITGRPQDGENYNIGFLNVVDAPYAQMVAAAQEFHREVYRRRLGMAEGER
jgi:hypothetical protein